MKDLLMKKWVVILIAIFCSILWGSAFPVVKISYEEMQIAVDDTMAKVVLAGIRFLLAGLILLVGIILWKPKSLKLTKRQLMFVILFGLIQTSLQYYFFYNGLAKTSGMQGAILVASGSFFTIVIAHFMYKNDRMDRAKVIGLIAGFAGIIVANWGQEFQFTFTMTGEGYMILAALTNAIGTIMAKELAIGIHPFALTGWQLTIGAVFLLVVGVPQLSGEAMVFTPFAWGLILYSALLSAVAFALWYSILKYHRAGVLSMFKFVTPVSGAILSAMFIPNEHLSLSIIAGLILVAFGIIIVNNRRSSKQLEKNRS